MTDDDVTSAASGSRSRQYEIRVRGHLGETMRFAFPSLRAQPRGEDTALTGACRTRPRCTACSPRFEALGLELLEVRRLPPR
jgi:hypothetical protein